MTPHEQALAAVKIRHAIHEHAENNFDDLAERSTEDTLMVGVAGTILFDALTMMGYDPIMSPTADERLKSQAAVVLIAAALDYYNQHREP